VSETDPEAPSGLPEGAEQDEPLVPADPPGEAPEPGEEAMPGIPTEGDPPAVS
jgi:hypothetical protein